MCTFQIGKNRIVVKREKLEFFAAESSNVSIKSGSNLRAAKAIRLQGRDVGNCSDDSIVMAEKEKNKKRGNYCAAGGPNMSNCANNSSTPGISMHYFPKDETLRQKWIRFVRIHRKDFVPSKSAPCALCTSKKRAYVYLFTGIRSKTLTQYFSAFDSNFLESLRVLYLKISLGCMS